MGLKQDSPAATWEMGGRRFLAIKPQWLNPGVIAHEQAHNSYALLPPEGKAQFAAVYSRLRGVDPLICLLYSKNRYGLTNDIEGHAEVYRYIGQQMPADLKLFYPRLFDSPAEQGMPSSPAGVPGKKARIILQPAPGTRSVISQPTLPVAVSSGDIDILCGSCSAVLFKGMVTESLGGIVVTCPDCGGHNEV
jgi:hypothetical protein